MEIRVIPGLGGEKFLGRDWLQIGDLAETAAEGRTGEVEETTPEEKVLHVS